MAISAAEIRCSARNPTHGVHAAGSKSPELSTAIGKSGDGPRSVRPTPPASSVTVPRRTTSTAGRCPMNVHTKPRLTLETYGHSGQKPRARPGSARTGCGPSPARWEWSRGIWSALLPELLPSRRMALAPTGPPRNVGPAWVPQRTALDELPTLTEQIGVGLCSVEARDDLLARRQPGTLNIQLGAAMGLRIADPLKSRRGWATLSQPSHELAGQHWTWASPMDMR